LLLMTLRGTPFLYMGDETGAERSSVPPQCVQDPFEKLVPGFGLGRDPERTPMRWDDSANGGFTTGAPWLPMSDDRSRNVQQQAADERSIVNLYRRLIELRRRCPSLVEGQYRPLRARDDVLSYGRFLGRSSVFVGLNISNEPRLWNCDSGERLISTHLDLGRETVNSPVLLRANEGIVVQS
jgi:alpha-glucosidase